jgi:hypothetical protein
MSDRLMTEADLERVTGKKRYSKQAEWFKAEFGISVTRAADGKIVMPWTTYEALSAKKAGLTGEGARTRAAVCSPFA